VRRSIFRTIRSTKVAPLDPSTFQIRRRPTYTKFLVRRVGLAVCFWIASSSWILASGRPRPAPTPFGFANLTTAKASGTREADAFLGEVVVSFVNQSTKSEAFVMTDKYGTALVPLKAGRYCSEAYDVDGKKLKLDRRANRGKPNCYIVSPNEIREVGLTIAADQETKATLPDASVE
jgi:hypothetical protein